MIGRTNHSTCLIITLTLLIGLLIPTLVQEGMFVDGVTYSAISKNLANGYGSLWEPHYTMTLYPQFYEHPPLVFWIQSGFFRLFGDAFYTERIFCVVITLLTVAGIVLCWRLLAETLEIKAFYWLPVLLWLTVPLVSWSYRNNLLENTMGLFTVFAVYFILRALLKDSIPSLMAGSVLILLAFLSKGPPGLFPLVAPLAFALVYPNRNKAIKYFFGLILLLLSISFLCAFLFPDIMVNLSKYFHQQFIPALSNQREITTDYRLKILLTLFLELLIPLLLVIMGILFSRRNRRVAKPFINKSVLLFLLIALSASVPLIISLKQRNFYLIPSIPFYVLSISFLLIRPVQTLINRVPMGWVKWMNRATVVTMIVIFVFSVFRFGDYSRDEQKLKDVYTISKHLAEGTILSTTQALWSDWNLVAYMSRVGYMSLDDREGHEYYLINKDASSDIPVDYELLDVPMNHYLLLKRRHATPPIRPKPQ